VSFAKHGRCRPQSFPRKRESAVSTLALRFLGLVRGPGEGVARPFAAHDSPLKAMGNDHATSSTFSRNLGTALRGFWFHAIDPLTPRPLSPKGEREECRNSGRTAVPKGIPAQIGPAPKFCDHNPAPTLLSWKRQRGSRMLLRRDKVEIENSGGYFPPSERRPEQ
jgi:hypothetical protein